MFSETNSNRRDPRALNAYRHGLTGQVHILTPADQAAYEKHCRGIHQSLAPVGAMETDLVQSIADDRWRLKRAAAIESAIFALGFADDDGPTAGHEEVDSAFAQARVWLAEGKNLQLLSLYEHRIQRHVERNLALLRQLQADRKTAPPPQSQAAPPPQSQAVAEPLPHPVPTPPFVFSNAPDPVPAAPPARLVPILIRPAA